MNLRKFIPMTAAAAVLAFSMPIVYAEDVTYVKDTYGLVSEEQLGALNTTAQAVSEQYGCGVYIRVTDYMGGYSDIEQYSEAVYTTEELGLGPEQSGVMLVIDMDSRSYDIVAYGEGNWAFTDYGKNLIADDVLGYLADEDYYGALHAFIMDSSSFLQAYQEDTPVDTWIPDPVPTPDPEEVKARRFRTNMGITCTVPPFISWVIVTALKSRNKTTSTATNANHYIAKNGIHYTRKTDILVNRTISRTPIVQIKDSGGHSGHMGGTTINTGGFSHHSGKF